MLLGAGPCPPRRWVAGRTYALARHSFLYYHLATFFATVAHAPCAILCPYSLVGCSGGRVAASCCPTECCGFGVSAWRHMASMCVCACVSCVVCVCNMGPRARSRPPCPVPVYATYAAKQPCRHTYMHTYAAALWAGGLRGRCLSAVRWVRARALLCSKYAPAPAPARLLALACLAAIALCFLCTSFNFNFKTLANERAGAGAAGATGHRPAGRAVGGPAASSQQRRTQWGAVPVGAAATRAKSRQARASSARPTTSQTAAGSREPGGSASRRGAGRNKGCAYKKAWRS
jgi:hypothetical protein